MRAGPTFRTRRVLRVSIGLAAALWAAVLAGLLSVPGAERQTILAAAAFLAFFGGFSFAYSRTWIAVTPDGIVSSTPLRVVRVAFAEIERIVVQDGVAGRLYAVKTRRGAVRFTSLLARHRELFELLVQRAGLARA